MQPLNTNSKYFYQWIKEEEYLVRKAQAVDIRKERATKRQKKIIYNDKII